MKIQINEVIWIGLSVCALSVAVAAVACDDPDAVSLEDLRLEALDPALEPQGDALARPAEAADDEDAWHHGIGGWHGGHDGWHGGHNGWHGEDDGGWHGWHEDDGGWHGWHGDEGEDGGWEGEDEGGWEDEGGGGWKGGE